MDWEKLINEHGPALLLYARQWAPSHADAEEAVQDGFVRLWRSEYRDLPDPLPLLYTCVKRSLFDRIRSQSRRAAREETVALEQPTECLFDSGLEDRERRELIERSLGGLPAEQREVLVMKIWGGLTFLQIAESLGIPANTAASRYRYALANLKKELEPAKAELR